MTNLPTKEKEQGITPDISVQNRFDIINDGLRKTYLSRLNEMQVAEIDVSRLEPLESDLIDNVRLYHVEEMVYRKGENAFDKLTTIYNTLSTYNASVFVLMDSNGEKTDFYIGVRNNEKNEAEKRSTVTLGDTLKNALIGHFPGAKISSEDRKTISRLSKQIASQHNVSSVSVVATQKDRNDNQNEQFVQGLEKLALAMQGRQYMALIVAQNQPDSSRMELRKNLEDLYSKLSPFQKVQFTDSESKSSSHAQSFFDMSGKQKAAMIGTAFASIGGVALGAFTGNHIVPMPTGTGAMIGAQIGGQAGGALGGFINSLAPSEQLSESLSKSQTSTVENKTVTDLLEYIDEALKRTKEYDSYGMWNVAGYFVSDDMSAAEIAASNYRSLMNGEESGREVSSINSWRSKDFANQTQYNLLMLYLSRFTHPQFVYGNSEDEAIYIDATTSISGKELGLHLGLPRFTIPGLPVIEHAEFGKEVYSYQLFSKENKSRPEDRMTLGRVFDLGKVTNKIVELDNKSLNMHTFITGSTGSGKSNTVYQILAELHQDGIPFLVVEPAKGEYKDVFGNWKDVNVYSTNPEIAELINLNPFRFPKSIHVLEHVDGLVEIFSACWPMYDAMPAFFKDAILKSYEACGWDLGSSTFEGDELEYPDFEILAEQLAELIEQSDYASDIKSNYRGALITRVKSLAVGLNKFLFTSEQTPYEMLFDENCILDISRVKSGETKALIMGMMVYILNEYRMDQKTTNNAGLKHVTVLEEAHNLLKNSGTHSGESDLIGKSVEMITQTIAEIRTYGEGFIIVDQSPSAVDIAAIKNTNTKIVLRTPEANDREAVGRSMGLTEDQVNEIAKLPSGVAVVYQNNWVKPVLTLINKANVTESKYIPTKKTRIRTQKEARTMIVSMLMEPWISRKRMKEEDLESALRVLDLSRLTRVRIRKFIEDYIIFGGHLSWKEEDLSELHQMIMEVLGIADKDFTYFVSADDLMKAVGRKLKNYKMEEIQNVCWILTYTASEEGSE